MTISGSSVNTQDTAVARQDIFKKIDQDGDGKITKDELKTALANRPGGNDGKGPSLDDLFSRIDTNGDGSIDESENSAFLDAQAKNRPHGQHGQHGQGPQGPQGQHGPQGPPDPAKIAQRLFEKADTDGDGKLTKSELTTALSKHGSPSSGASSSSGSSGASSSSALDDLFNDADADGDGAITQSELQAGLEKRLQRFTSYDQHGTVSTSAAGTSQTLGVA